MAKINNSQTYFEQYKMLVESSEKISDKRMAANNYFLTINTGLISLAGFLITSKAINSITTFLNVVGALGLIICFVWLAIVFSYKQLNSAKFSLIHKLEARLPIHTFSEEWKLLGEGKNLNKYIPLSYIELLVPIVFIIFYSIFIFIKF